MPQNLNPQQKAAAEAAPGPLMIVAGAGTGKTKTLTSRIIHLIKEGVPPEKICAITFTNKAANEMRGRISNSQFSISNFQTPFIGTFHSLGAKILRSEAHLIGRTQNFIIFDDDDSFSLIKKIVKKYFPRERGAREPQNKKEAPSYFAKKISEIKNIGGEKNENILKIFREYEDALKKNNAFDFDDLIEKPVSIFQKHHTALKRWQRKFDAILIDEYQDLNPKQYEFVRLLCGKCRNLSVVGDDEQMIYGWRYADIKIFLNFDRDWPGAQTAFLEENYRSTGNIINAASAVAKNNLWRTPKTLWTKNPDGEPIKIVNVEDEEREAEWIADQIESGILKLESETDKNSQGQIPSSKPQIPATAVLYRTNAQSRAIEQALIRRQIPYKIFGGVRFYERKEIKDVIAALRWFFNPKDAVSRERLEKNLSKSKFRALEEALIGASSGSDTTSNNDRVRGHKASPTNLINIFLESTDYLECLEKTSLNPEERRGNIKELIGFASKFDDLGQFLEEIALAQPTDQIINSQLSIINETKEVNNKKPENWPLKIENYVHLMTIHLAKGLEFDRVFIAGCSEGLLPHAMSMDNRERIDEERRLMYVAMTRAKQELNISFYDLPSRFIGEIPEGLTEYKALAEENMVSDNEEEFFLVD